MYLLFFDRNIPLFKVLTVAELYQTKVRSDKLQLLFHGLDQHSVTRLKWDTGSFTTVDNKHISERGYASTCGTLVKLLNLVTLCDRDVCIRIQGPNLRKVLDHQETAKEMAVQSMHVNKNKYLLLVRPCVNRPYQSLGLPTRLFQTRQRMIHPGSPNQNVPGTPKPSNA